MTRIEKLKKEAMTEKFLFCVSFVLRPDIEGEYSNHKSDRGGETKFGISKRAFPDLDIKSLTKEDATAIYYTHYYEKINGESLPAKVAVVIFDWAVNSGVALAVRSMQRVLGVKVDGIIGEKTLKAIYEQEECKLCLDLLEKRRNFYKSLGGFSVFGKGWMRRIEKLRDYIKCIIH